jgi:hypothetical protein
VAGLSDANLRWPASPLSAYGWAGFAQRSVSSSDGRIWTSSSRCKDPILGCLAIAVWSVFFWGLTRNRLAPGRPMYPLPILPCQGILLDCGSTGPGSPAVSVPVGIQAVPLSSRIQMALLGLHMFSEIPFCTRLCIDVRHTAILRSKSALICRVKPLRPNSGLCTVSVEGINPRSLGAATSGEPFLCLVP